MISFEETVHECLKNRELLQQYRRLTGARLGISSPWEKLVDQATGYGDEEWKRFFDFVRDYIWLPVVLNKT